MKNRGIPHDELEWLDAGNGGGSWTIHTKCELLGSVKVDIPSKSRDAGLTPTQQRALQMIRGLPKTLRDSLNAALRKYAIVHTGIDADANDIYFGCDNISVPHLENSDSVYLFLNADSPIDEEHGVCFLLRDGEVACCCHGDESLQFYGWDATDELDALADEVA